MSSIEKIDIIINKEELPALRPYRMKDLLLDNTFDIPSYQRLYSWGRPEAEDLLNDVISVAKRRRYLHFFGNIITFPISNKDNANKALIDGQQRTTTSMVLIAIMRDIAKSLINKLPKKNQSLDDKNAVLLNNIKMSSNTLLFGNNYEHGSDLLTLHIQDINDNKQQDYKHFFNGMIIDDNKHPFSKFLNRKYEPIKLLNNVHNILRHDLQQIISEQNTISKKAKLLSRLFNSFINQFYVIVMKANSRPEALTIYMTLNSRGKGLSVPDIIKGNLAGIINHKRDQSVKRLMEYWDSITSSLNDQTKKVANFLKLYWIASHNYVSNIRNLPRDIIKNINTPAKVNEMINDLSDLVPVYKELLDPNLVSSHNIGILDSRIEILNRIGLKHYYPIVLAMYHNHYSETNMNDIFNLIINIEMRLAICGNLDPDYNSLIRYLWCTPVYDLNKIQELLNKSRINDNIVYLSCRAYQKRLTKNKKGKFVSLMAYILANYYSYQYGDFNDTASIYRNLFLHQNYILIRIDNNNQDIFNDLGNYVLIEKSLQQHLKKYSTDNLIDILGQSKLQGNHKLKQEISSNKDDLENFVNKRQNNLAKDYIKIW